MNGRCASSAHFQLWRSCHVARLIRRIRADGPHRDVRASVLDRLKTVGAAPSPRKEAPISRRGWRRSYAVAPRTAKWRRLISTSRSGAPAAKRSYPSRAEGGAPTGRRSGFAVGQRAARQCLFRPDRPQGGPPAGRVAAPGARCGCPEYGLRAIFCNSHRKHC